jgi:hypothetical protein
MPEGYVAYELGAAGKMVRELLNHGADVDTADIHGRTPLMMAAMHGWPEALRALLDAHANIRARDRAGHTVLDFVDPIETEVVKTLKKAGAPPPSGQSARMVCDVRPLMMAAMHGCSEALRAMGSRTRSGDSSKNTRWQRPESSIRQP